MTTQPTNMPPANDNHPANRPAEFDTRVMAFRPGLLRLARKYRRDPEDRADLVTDTIIKALHRWQSYREEGGMWNWLSFTLREVARDGNLSVGRTVRVVEAPILYENASTQPAQEDYAHLSAVLRQLSDRGGHVVLRQAMGDTLVEISADMGVTSERARQLAAEERARLAKRKLRVAA